MPTFSISWPPSPKYTQRGILGLKINHLATIVCDYGKNVCRHCEGTIFLRPKLGSIVTVIAWFCMMSGNAKFVLGMKKTFKEVCRNLFCSPDLTFVGFHHLKRSLSGLRPPDITSLVLCLVNVQQKR
jgi:hypothetical protein